MNGKASLVVGALAALCTGCTLRSSKQATPAGEVASARFGDSCDTAGGFAFGSGSLLICDRDSYRYALRTDVPDGSYGGFATRPSWYPPLRTMFSLPPASCHLTFSHAPIDAADVASIVPYGSVVGGHVTPIDHQYIIPSTLHLPAAERANVPVRAPAKGTILSAASLGAPTQLAVAIAHDCETATVYMVVNQLAGVLAPYQAAVAGGQMQTLNLPIAAGETFAMQRDNPLDFMVEDGSAWLSGFAHPFPYVSADAWKPYVADPLLYMPPDLASQYEAKMQRVESPRSGKLDWDRAGTAAGNWFLEGTYGYSGIPVATYQNATGEIPSGQVSGKNASSWSHLSLVPHWIQPQVWLASVGTWKDPAGDFMQFGIRPGPPSPDAVTPAHGIVVYELAQFMAVGADGAPLDTLNLPVGYRVAVSDTVVGVLAVRVNENHTITIEKRPDLQAAAQFAGFTARAETYWR